METLWIIFYFSFLAALSGAVAPGPLLTYTIVKTVQTRKRGFLIGAWVIGGHALLESVLIVAILLGFAVILKMPVVIRIIGVLGGLFLLYLGVGLIRDVVVGRIPDVFGNGDSAVTVDAGRSGQSRFERTPPVLGGIVISMSNPYWWVWWATIGFAFMHRFEISFRNWQALLAFVVGHEAGDLVWYVFVSSMVHLGKRRLNAKVYHVLLVLCGVFMMGFGVYLGVSPFVT